MKVKLIKNCVIGVGKTGSKGKTVDVDEAIAKQLIAAGAAEKPKDGKDDK